MKSFLSRLIGVGFFVLMLTQPLEAQKNSCERNANFGTAEICLPIVEGYKECYLEPPVTELADLTEVSGNSVLGYYLNDAVYAKKDSLGSIKFDDYWKVYVTDQMENYVADHKALKEIEGALGNNFVFEDFKDLVEEEFDEKDLDIEIGAPTVVNSYKPNEDVATYIMVVKYKIEDAEYFTMAMAINILLLEERLVWMAYYLNYEGPKTISKLQAKSGAIVGRLVGSNK